MLITLHRADAPPVAMLTNLFCNLLEACALVSVVVERTGMVLLFLNVFRDL